MAKLTNSNATFWVIFKYCCNSFCDALQESNFNFLHCCCSITRWVLLVPHCENSAKVLQLMIDDVFPLLSWRHGGFVTYNSNKVLSWLLLEDLISDRVKCVRVIIFQVGILRGHLWKSVVKTAWRLRVCTSSVLLKAHHSRLSTL